MRCAALTALFLLAAGRATPDTSGPRPLSRDAEAASLIEALAQASTPHAGRATLGAIVRAGYVETMPGLVTLLADWELYDIFPDHGWSRRDCLEWYFPAAFSGRPFEALLRRAQHASTDRLVDRLDDDDLIWADVQVEQFG